MKVVCVVPLWILLSRTVAFSDECKNASRALHYLSGMMDPLPPEFPIRDIETPLGKRGNRSDYFFGLPDPDMMRFFHIVSKLDLLENHQKINITLAFLGGSFTTGRMPGPADQLYPPHSKLGYSNQQFQSSCKAACLGVENGEFSIHSDCQACAYPARFLHWLRSSYAHANSGLPVDRIKVFNLAVPGSTSLSIMGTLPTLLKALQPSIDMFFINYVDNDRNFYEREIVKVEAGYELLVRFLLSLPNRPAVFNIEMNNVQFVKKTVMLQ